MSKARRRSTGKRRSPPPGVDTSSMRHAAASRAQSPPSATAATSGATPAQAVEGAFALVLHEAAEGQRDGGGEQRTAARMRRLRDAGGLGHRALPRWRAGSRAYGHHAAGSSAFGKNNCSPPMR